MFSMLPYISSKDISNRLFLSTPTDGNHKNGGLRTSGRSLKSKLTTSDVEIDKTTRDTLGHLNQTFYGQKQASFVPESPEIIFPPLRKARKISSLKETILPVKAQNTPETLSTPTNLKRKSSFQETDTPISNSLKSVSIKDYRLHNPVTPIGRREKRAKFSNSKVLEQNLNQSQTQDSRNLNRSNLKTQNLRSSPGISVSKPSLKAKGNVSVSINSNSKNYYDLCKDTSRSGSDSEDPLTSSLFVSYFHPKTPNKTRSSQKLEFPSASQSKIRSGSLSIPNTRLRSAIDKQFIEEEISSEDQRVRSCQPMECNQPFKTTELSTKVQLRPRKEQIKIKEVKRARKDKMRTYREVPVPDPVYYPFKCEWDECRAELMNMEILRKHMYVVHGRKLECGGRRCLWRKCGESWKNACSESCSSTHSDSDDDSIADLRIIYPTRREWKEHIEEHHLIPFSWHMGDGPCGSRLAKPSTVWQQSYLFSADGKQATPSVASQPIEDGVMRKLNARRFRWQHCAGPYGGDILVPISQIDENTCLRSFVGSNDDTMENKADNDDGKRDFAMNDHQNQLQKGRR
ncbi:putative c2h2 finger domain-containing protein [Golovinomyces cichoracearum]|uniref:Putative c2h2 finger domain-containing protein n=1 Tax=Golovinomyces cichoracearum TaxID=62708 RepID=A0A420HQH0_9PEZI|nr:putative c2h2 finger domain-containing protein [Golovinomyces cichoracearum]